MNATSEAYDEPHRGITRPAKGTVVSADRTRRGLERAGFALALVAAASFFWLFDALPFQDLPAHAGLIALRERIAQSPFEQRYFVLSEHIGPYSLFRWMGGLFARMLGPVSAVRALGTLPLVATPLSILFARYRLHGDRSLSYGYFGIALSLGLMTLLGFASYLLAIPVLIVALTFWLERLEEPSVPRSAPSTR